MAGETINQSIDRLRESFLLAAASGGRLLECQSLLELGAETDFATSDDTPLIAAVRNGHRAIVSLLLAHGADPMVKDRHNNSVLHITAETSGDEAMASLFSPNASVLSLALNNMGKTAIDLAVERGDTAFAEHLHHLCETNNANSDSDTFGSSQSSEIPLISSLGIDDDGDTENSSNGEEFNVPTIDDEDYQEDCNGSKRSQLKLYQAKYALSAVMKERDDLTAKLNKLEPFSFYIDDNSLAHKSLQELQAYERQVKNALERIEKAKQNLEEEKLCVICRENPKEVLMMPCRHLCVCKDCGYRVELTCCPLCREATSERLTVFN